MGVVLVVAIQPDVGKTAVATGLAYLLAYQGRKVHLVRLRSDAAEDPQAQGDAELFASLSYSAAPDGPRALSDAISYIQDIPDEATVILEAASAMAAEAVAGSLNASVLIVALADEDALSTLAEQAKASGERLVGVVVTGAVPVRAAQVSDQLRTVHIPVLAVLPEDRLLAAPSIQDIIDALGARILVDGAARDTPIPQVQIGSIGSDPGVSYFGRVADKAVVTRYDKTDVLLSALNTFPPLIVISGGREPSSYVIDRASNNEGLTILLSPYDTRETVSRISALYQRVPFFGKPKVERMGELLRQHLHDEFQLARLQ